MIWELMRSLYREIFYNRIEKELTGEQMKAGKWIIDDLLAHGHIPTVEIVEYLIENSKESKP